MQSSSHPPIRTFHARHGRISASRLEILENVVPEFEISQLSSPIDLRKIFPGLTTVVDFGSGMGHHAHELLQAGFGVLAIDVHKPGISRIAEIAHNESLSSLKVHLGDGLAVLTDTLAPQCVDELHVMFPDPWPKARHNKRRVIQHTFLDLADRVLAAQGEIIMVTDDDSYAEHMNEVFSQSATFELSDESVEIPQTRYKRRADHMRNTIHGFRARRRVQPNSHE